MKKSCFLFVLLWCGISCFAQQLPAHLFEGKWVMKKGNSIIGEEWVKINDDHLQNRGYYIKGGDTVVTERVALQKINGEVFYTSTVEDQNDKKPVAFRLTSSTDKLFIFENPAHDYPKRIVYEFTSADSLHAYIDDGVAGTNNRRDFYYTKMR